MHFEDVNRFQTKFSGGQYWTTCSAMDFYHRVRINFTYIKLSENKLCLEL